MDMSLFRHGHVPISNHNMYHKINIKCYIILFGTAPKTSSSIIVLDVVLVGGGCLGHDTFAWSAPVTDPMHQLSSTPVQSLPEWQLQSVRHRHRHTTAIISQPMMTRLSRSRFTEEAKKQKKDKASFLENVASWTRCLFLKKVFFLA